MAFYPMFCISWAERSSCLYVVSFRLHKVYSQHVLKLLNNAQVTITHHREEGGKYIQRERTGMLLYYYHCWMSRMCLLVIYNTITTRKTSSSCFLFSLSSHWKIVLLWKFHGGDFPTVGWWKYARYGYGILSINAHFVMHDSGFLWIDYGRSISSTFEIGQDKQLTHNES